MCIASVAIIDLILKCEKKRILFVCYSLGNNCALSPH